MEKLPIIFAFVVILAILSMIGLGFAIAKVGLIAIVWMLAGVGFASILKSIFG